MHWHAFHHLSIRGTDTLGIGIITRSVLFLQRYFAAAKRSGGPTNSTWRKFVQTLREMNFDNTQSGYATSAVSTERSPTKCAQKSSKEPRHRAHWRGSETEGRSVTSLTTNENKIPRSTVALVSGSFPQLVQVLRRCPPNPLVHSATSRRRRRCATSGRIHCANRFPSIRLSVCVDCPC